MRKNETDIEQVEKLRENLIWLKNKMPGVIKIWKSRNPICEYYPSLIGKMCTSPGLIENEIFDPVIKWLSDYQLMREGRISLPTSKNLDNFIILGLKIIYNFIYFAEFLSKNTDFFTGDLKSQKEYTQILNEISSQLIGCNETLSFLFLKLSRTVKQLSPDMKQIQNYLDTRCQTIRIQNLK